MKSSFIALKQPQMILYYLLDLLTKQQQVTISGQAGFQASLAQTQETMDVLTWTCREAISPSASHLPTTALSRCAKLRESYSSSLPKPQPMNSACFSTRKASIGSPVMLRASNTNTQSCRLDTLPFQFPTCPLHPYRPHTYGQVRSRPARLAD